MKSKYSEFLKKMCRRVLRRYCNGVRLIFFFKPYEALGHYSRESRTISLNANLLNLRNADTLLETLKHEIAHAYVDRRKNQKHNSKWQAVCLKLNVCPRAYSQCKIREVKRRKHKCDTTAVYSIVRTRK